jgi:F-type H+-transporting ATPase subunit delta
MSSKTLIAKVALPYAEALLELTQKASIIDQTNQEVTIIRQLLTDPDNLIVFLANPLVAPVSKKEVIKQLFADQISDILLIFMLILVDRRRIAFINEILDRYLSLLYSLESVVVATVRTSTIFNIKQEHALIGKLQEMTGNSQVRLDVSIDPELIGGFTVQIGSKFIDTSLRGQLKEIASFLNTGI